MNVFYKEITTSFTLLLLLALFNQNWIEVIFRVPPTSGTVFVSQFPIDLFHDFFFYHLIAPSTGPGHVTSCETVVGVENIITREIPYELQLWDSQEEFCNHHRPQILIFLPHRWDTRRVDKSCGLHLGSLIRRNYLKIRALKQSTQ